MTFKKGEESMDITLEKIDIVRDRTGVSYRQAKEALESTDGNVVDALIRIEEEGSRNWSDSMTDWKDNVTETFSVKGTEAVDKIKNLIQSGNVSRIRVKKDDYVIMDIPVTAGAIGAAIIPQYAALGAVVAVLTKCTIEVEKSNKEIINVSDAITSSTDNITSKIKNVANDIKQAARNMQRRGGSGSSNESRETEDLNDYNYKGSVDFDTTIENDDNGYKQ